LTLKGKINSVRLHPSILKDAIQGKSAEEIRAKVRSLELNRTERLGIKEVPKFISHLKRMSPYHINPNDKPKLNRLCYIEDWENSEIKEAICALQYPPDAITRRLWEMALSIIAMRRFGKLNNNSKAIGVASATEVLLFYLANNLNHVYATDLYDSSKFRDTPSDFPDNPKKYAPFPYKEDALTVLRMDGTKLEFPSGSFDIAFSISSIEHFGGENHSGALKGLREIERVLKPGGIATITTEYIINDKEHPEFFNRRTIYSDLINKLEKLQLVEPLDLRITLKTLDTVMGFDDSLKWGTMDDEIKKTHPHVLLRIRDILLSSIMLVFQKQ
jgi:SAM-dependent methyltransferase